MTTRTKGSCETFGTICNINAIYNIFSNDDSNPIPQNSSQADKYLTNMAVTDPTKVGLQWSKWKIFGANLKENCM